MATKKWRCFHCDEVFYSAYAASIHFGRSEDKTPACRLLVGTENSILTLLREVEGELDKAIAALHNESNDFAKAFHSQTARYSAALIRAEELGYSRGLRDGRSIPPDNFLTIKET